MKANLELTSKDDWRTGEGRLWPPGHLQLLPALCTVCRQNTATARPLCAVCGCAATGELSNCDTGHMDLKLKIFIIWSFAEKLCQLLLETIKASGLWKIFGNSVDYFPGCQEKYKSYTSRESNSYSNVCLIQHEATKIKCGKHLGIWKMPQLLAELGLSENHFLISQADYLMTIILSSFSQRDYETIRRRV